MSQLGRISGALLKSDLSRDGIDLAFETDLLYLKVSPRILGTVGAPEFDDGDPNYPRGNLGLATGVGINTDVPTRDLLINNYFRSNHLIVSTEYNIPDFTINTNVIQQLTVTIYIEPDQTSNPVISVKGLSTDYLRFSGNGLVNSTLNDDINLSPVAGGMVNIRNNVNVSETLNATGNITFYGNITLGNEASDTITFDAEVASNIVPVVPIILVTPISEQLLSEALEEFVSEDNQPLFTNPGDPYYTATPVWSLGSSSNIWNTLYSEDIVIDTPFYPTNVTATTLNAGNIRISANTITDVIPINNLVLSPTDTLSINGTPVLFADGNNFVTPADETIILDGTLNRYPKFSGTTGLVIPKGSDSERLPVSEAGTTRLNTDSDVVEIWTGTQWIPVYGNSSTASLADVIDVMDVWGLVLG